MHKSAGKIVQSKYMWSYNYYEQKIVKILREKTIIEIMNILCIKKKNVKCKKVFKHTRTYNI